MYLIDHSLHNKLYNIHTIFAQVGKLTDLFRAFAGKDADEEKFSRRQKMRFPGKIFLAYETERYMPLQGHTQIYNFLKLVWMKETSVIMKAKLIEFKDKIIFIKIRLQERRIMSRSKVEMFLIRWDQLVF